MTIVRQPNALHVCYFLFGIESLFGLVCQNRHHRANVHGISHEEPARNGAALVCIVVPSKRDERAELILPQRAGEEAGRRSANAIHQNDDLVWVLSDAEVDELLGYLGVGCEIVSVDSEVLRIVRSLRVVETHSVLDWSSYPVQL